MLAIFLFTVQNWVIVPADVLILQTEVENFLRQLKYGICLGYLNLAVVHYL
jgi:hypothetical protein